MTIRDAGRDVVTEFDGMQDYRIGFAGNDETELTATNMNELENLWESLAPEFGCEVDEVDYVERV